MTGPAASELAYLACALKAPRIRAVSARLADRARDEGWGLRGWGCPVLVDTPGLSAAAVSSFLRK